MYIIFLSFIRHRGWFYLDGLEDTAGSLVADRPRHVVQDDAIKFAHRVVEVVAFVIVERDVGDHQTVRTRVVEPNPCACKKK